MDTLTKLRDRIDWLDSQIASLLNERMRAADQVGRVKKEQQLKVADQSREKKVLENVETTVQHPVLKSNIANIYNAIMQESRIAQHFYHHTTMPFQSIGIIGMGLIGGSICKAIKLKNPGIKICTVLHGSEEGLLEKTGAWIDGVYSTLAGLTQNCELIILASPIGTIIPLAQEIRRQASNQKLLVIDVASVKSQITAEFEELTLGQIEYLSTHPMSGKETNGFANSQATLFVNRPWLVVPHGKNSSRALESVIELIRYVGAEPITLSAEEHDKQTALISHLPALISRSYLDYVNSINPEITKISGPGFQSFTRLAHDNPEMRHEIAGINQRNIVHYLEKWLEHIKTKEA